MKLLGDTNLSPRWIPFLLDAGYEAVHWSTVGKADATESETWHSQPQTNPRWNVTECLAL